MNKGTEKQYVAVFCYTIQLITIKLCSKFQNPYSSSLGCFIFWTFSLITYIIKQTVL